MLRLTARIHMNDAGDAVLPCPVLADQQHWNPAVRQFANDRHNRPHARAGRLKQRKVNEVILDQAC